MFEQLNGDTRPFVRVRLGSETAMLGPYRLHERLGAGGLASVYRARRVDDPDAPDVALKRLHPHLAHDVAAIASLVKEMHIACLLEHPLIRRVHALCREQGELFMIMEYVDGRSLMAVMKRAYAAQRRLPLRGVLAVLHRLCSALHHAHELVDEYGDSARFVHRDISPSNLLVSPSGQLKLIDMGAARARVGDVATKAGVIRGKYGYMAPEILSGKPYDRRADVFSIGVVAWEMLTVRKLFPVCDGLEEADRARARPVAPPSRIDPSCPAELDHIVMRALATAPGDRWPTCLAMADAVQELASRLHQPLSDNEIAEVAEIGATAGVPLPPAAGRRRLARGTHGDPDSVSASSAEAPPEPERPLAARTGTAFALGTLFGSLVTLLAIVALPRPGAPVASSPTGARRPVGAHDARIADAGPDAGVDAGPDAGVDAGPDAGVDAGPDAGVDAGPDAGALTVPAADVTRIDGPWPRSRTSSYPYRARLCIDAEGAVTAVEVLEGPERLDGRIRYALRRWRYEPYVRDGGARPVCFVIESEVHEMSPSR